MTSKEQEVAKLQAMVCPEQARQSLDLPLGVQDEGLCLSPWTSRQLTLHQSSEGSLADS